MKNHDINLNTIHRYLAGECTVKEKRRVHRWMDADPANRRQMKVLREIWAVQPNKELKSDIQAAWKNLEQQMETKRHPESASDLVTRQQDFRDNMPMHSYDIMESGYMWLRVAAVILVTFLLTLVFVEFNSNEQRTQREVTMREVVTKRAHQAELTFSDGTRVVLNAASQIRFPQEFHPGVREVYLEGEAYFEVAHKEESAFIVQTKDAQVKVLGTKFNVKARSEDEEVEVAVAEGKVSFQSSSTDQAGGDSLVILTKGQMSEIKSGLVPTRPKEVDINDYLTWLRGNFVFKEVPFSQVLAEWERRFDVEFAVRDSSLFRKLFTGEFRNEPLDEILRLTSQSLDFTYSRNASTITIEAK